MNFPNGLDVATSLAVQADYSVDGGPLVQAGPFTGTSAPSAAPGPVPGAGLAGLVTLALASLYARARGA